MVSDRLLSLFRLYEKLESKGQCERTNGSTAWSFSVLVSPASSDHLLSFFAAFSEDIEDVVLDGTPVYVADIDQTRLNAATAVEVHVTFNVNLPIFYSLDQAKTVFCQSTDRSKNVVIFETGTLSLQEDNDEHINDDQWLLFLASYEAADCCLKMVARLAHHRSAEHALFVDPSGRAANAVNLHIDAGVVYGLFPDALANIETNEWLLHLVRDLEAQSPNYLKELALFRASVIEFFSGRTSEEPLENSHTILTELADVKQRYEDNLQAYLSEITIKQLRTQLASEQLKFSEHASKGLMDITGKMFALPGALILLKLTGQQLEATVSVAAVVLTSLILCLSLFAQLQLIGTVQGAISIALDEVSSKIKSIRDAGLKDSLSSVRNKLDRTISFGKICVYFYLTCCIGTTIYVLAPEGTMAVLATLASYASDLVRALQQHGLPTAD